VEEFGLFIEGNSFDGFLVLIELVVRIELLLGITSFA
jgi:hypothetical protein